MPGYIEEPKMKAEEAKSLIKDIFGEKVFSNLSQWDKLFIKTCVEKHTSKKSATEWLLDFKNHMLGKEVK